MVNFNILIDNHLSADLLDYSLVSLSLKRLEEFVEYVKPTKLTVFAVGHDGLAQYPSRVARTAPGMPIDLVGMWAGICRARGIKFAIYLSTLRNDILLVDQPDWIRIRLDGHTSNKIEHTSPFFEKWLMPVLKELHESYSPDGFFFDGDYWAVGESTSIYRLEAARNHWNDRTINKIEDLSVSEHRELTVESYASYLRALGAYLSSLENSLVSSVNLAFTFRHPTAPPPGISLVTSDLPPFFGALESWIETAVLLGRGIHRDLVVPLYVEPEGGGRKYAKSIGQLMHETAPLVANGNDIHVYFPMDRSGIIKTNYADLFVELRDKIQFIESKSIVENVSSDFDVLCIADGVVLQNTQNFTALRGVFVAACTCGLNVGVASLPVCWQHLDRVRLLILPKCQFISTEARELILAAQDRGISVIDENCNQTHAELSLNQEASNSFASVLLLNYKYSEVKSIWAGFTIHRPWTTFVRGLVGSNNTWRLFLWNGLKKGTGIGRHVSDDGAAFAGTHSVSVPPSLLVKYVSGASNLRFIGSIIEFDMDGPSVSIEGTYI